MSEQRVGIIGGSGLYDIEGFSNQTWKKVETPFGNPSDEFLIGELEGREVVFLPRHARGHRILPSELNHRANIWAMKKLGVRWIISVSAVGSLQPQYKPCDIVLINQFVDRTKQSLNHTFFGEGIVAHIAFAHPISEELRQILLKTSQEQGAVCHDGGAYVNMNCPFSLCAPPMADDKFIVGDFMVIRHGSAPRFDERMRLKEDYDFTAQHLDAYGSVCRMNRLYVRARHYTNAGGAVDVRTAPLEQTTIAYLRDKWARRGYPSLFRTHTTRANEVVMRLSKAEKARLAQKRREGPCVVSMDGL